jgi:toxin ParE1/3/4
MVKIIWTKRAFQQFERVVHYIKEEQGLYYASIVHSKIIESITNLQAHPLIGTREPALLHKKSEYRFLIVWSYKIIYKFDASKIVISRIFHTSRNPIKLRGL